MKLILFVLLFFCENCYSQKYVGILKYSSCYATYEVLIGDSNFEIYTNYNTLNLKPRKIKKILKMANSSTKLENDHLMDFKIKIEIYENKNKYMSLLIDNAGYLSINEVKFNVNIKLLKEINRLIPNNECWDHLLKTN